MGMGYREKTFWVYGTYVEKVVSGIEVTFMRE